MKMVKARELRLPTGALGLALSPDGKQLFASCVDGSIFSCNPATGALARFEAKHESYASGCVALPDGKSLVSAGYDGWLLWHDVSTKSCFRRLKAHSFWSWQLALSPDGQHVASVSGQYLVGGERYEPAPAAEPTVKVFTTLTGDLVRAFEHGPPVQSVAFSPDGRLVAAGNMMGEIKVWDIATGELVGHVSTPDFTSWGIIKSPHYCGGIYGLAFSNDGTALTACGMGPMTDPMAGNGKMTWQRWNWQSKPPAKLDQVRDGERGAGLMEALAFAPDGKSFVMAGKQAQGTWNAALFSAEDGKLLASLDTKSRITRAAFAANGTTLYLAGAVGQGGPNRGKWPEWGRIYVVNVG